LEQSHPQAKSLLTSSFERKMNRGDWAEMKNRVFRAILSDEARHQITT